MQFDRRAQTKQIIHTHVRMQSDDAMYMVQQL